MNLKSFDSDRADIWLANAQIVASLIALGAFPFLSTRQQIFIIGIVTMITWTGTAFAHRSAARAKIEIQAQKVDVKVDNGHNGTS